MFRAAECTTLTSCGECHTNRFCTFCLSTGACALNATQCDPMDTVTVDGECPAVVAYSPSRGDVLGGTEVSLTVDYNAHYAGPGDPAGFACQWNVGLSVATSPWMPTNATHGVCRAPPQVCFPCLCHAEVVVECTRRRSRLHRLPPTPPTTFPLQPN